MAIALFAAMFCWFTYVFIRDMGRLLFGSNHHYHQVNQTIYEMEQVVNDIQCEVNLYNLRSEESGSPTTDSRSDRQISAIENLSFENIELD